MIIHRIFQSIKTYYLFTRNISQFHSKYFIYTLFKLLYFRFYAKLGPTWFDLYGFINKPIKSYEQYLTNEDRYRLQESISPVEYRYLEEDKIIFHDQCMKHNIPTCPILLLVTFNENYNPTENVDVARNKAGLEEKLLACGNREIISKPVDGGQGYGIDRIVIEDGNFTTSSGQYGPIIDLFDYFHSLPFSENGYIIQPFLKAHPAMIPIMPGPGLGTIRIITFITKNNEVNIAWAVLKIPGEKQIQDNWQKGTSGTLLSLIDLEKGSLISAMGTEKNNPLLHQIEYHPVTKTKFTGFNIHLWNECIQTVKNAATKFPELLALGWDVAITETGPVIIEANWESGLDMFQILSGKGFKKEFLQYIDELKIIEEN